MPILQVVWAALNQKINHDTRLIVAYSGGKDSHVLLHALSQIRDSRVHTDTHFTDTHSDFPIALEAWHVNHGLSSNADVWVEHCKKKL